MKKYLLIAPLLLLTGSLFAADPSAKDEVSAAITKLGQAANYSWHTTVVVPEGSRFQPGPSEGETEKGGYTVAKFTIRDTTAQLVMKGDKGVATNPDGEWQTAEEMADAEGPARFIARMLRTFKSPVTQAQDIVVFVKEISKTSDAYSGDLTEDGAKSLLSMRRRSGEDAPKIDNAKGSATFWINDGTLSKFEVKVSGTVHFNDTDNDIERTTTVTISYIGTTKVEVPDAAKKKLELGTETKPEAKPDAVPTATDK